MNRIRDRKNSAWVLLALSAVAGTCTAETVPTRGAVDSRIRTATYNAQEVYTLRGIVGYAIELIFEDGETFAGTGGGDLEGVTIDAHGNSVLLKPRAAIVATNLVVFTDRRAYRFDYSVSSRSVARSTGDTVYAVRFLYPPKGIGTNGESLDERIARKLAQANEVRPRNTDYWYCGKPSIKPKAAFDDGVHTHLTFGSQSEIPALFVRNEDGSESLLNFSMEEGDVVILFVRNEDGSESLLNFSMEEGDVVIHRVAPKFILRRGRTTGCIVNKGFAGAGMRLDTGTVSPGVRRDVKEPRS